MSLRTEETTESGTRNTVNEAGDVKTKDLHIKHISGDKEGGSHVAELRHSRYLCDDHMNNTPLTCNIHHGCTDDNDALKADGNSSVPNLHKDPDDEGDTVEYLSLKSTVLINLVSDEETKMSTPVLVKVT